MNCDDHRVACLENLRSLVGSEVAPIQTISVARYKQNRMETAVEASLPRFLKPVQSAQCSQSPIQDSVPVRAIYTHKRPFGDAHVLWWPIQTRRACDGSSNKAVPTQNPRTILLFIPGTSSSSCLGGLGVGSRSGSHSCFIPLFRFVCVWCLLHPHFASLRFRKPRTARLLCAVFKRDLP